MLIFPLQTEKCTEATKIISDLIRTRLRSKFIMQYVFSYCTCYMFLLYYFSQYTNELRHSFDFLYSDLDYARYKFVVQVCIDIAINSFNNSLILSISIYLICLVVCLFVWLVIICFFVGDILLFVLTSSRICRSWLASAVSKVFGSVPNVSGTPTPITTLPYLSQM